MFRHNIVGELALTIKPKDKKAWTKIPESLLLLCDRLEKTNDGEFEIVLFRKWYGKVSLQEMSITNDDCVLMCKNFELLEQKLRELIETALSDLAEEFYGY